MRVLLKQLLGERERKKGGGDEKKKLKIKKLKEITTFNIIMQFKIECT